MHPAGRTITKLAGSLLKYRKALFLGALGFLLAIAFYSRVPPIDTALDSYATDNNPYYAAGKKITGLFGSLDMISIKVFPEDGKADSLFVGLEQLAASMEGAFPGARVVSVHRAAALLLRDTGREAGVREVLTRALDIPLIAHLVGRDTLSLATLVFLEKDVEYVPAEVDALVKRDYPGIAATAVTSRRHIEAQVYKAILRDYLFLIPLAFLFVTLFLFHTYRSFRAIAYFFFYFATSITVVLFYYSVFRIDINQVTSSAVLVVFVLSVSASVHLLTGFLFHRSGGHAGENRAEPTGKHLHSTNDRIHSTLQLYFWPCFLTTLTTSVAFGSFVLSDYEHIRQFGYLVALSLMTVFMLTFMTAPLLLRLANSARDIPSDGALSGWVNNFIASRRKQLSILLVGILLVSVWFIPRIQFRTELETFIPRRSQVFRDYVEIKKSFDPAGEIDLLIETRPDRTSGDTPGRQETLRMVGEISSRMASYPEVTSVSSFADQLDFERRHAAFGIRPVLFPRSGNPYVSADQRQFRIRVRMEKPENAWAVQERLAEDFLPYAQDYSLETYSSFLFFHYLNRSATGSLTRSLVVSCVIIFMILFAMTKSLRAILVTLLANMVPFGFVVLAIVSFNIEMNMVTSMALVVCLGLIVDDTIHILYRRVNRSMPIGELGFGVVTTSIILGGGFLAYTLSQWLPTQYFVSLCALAFFTAMVSDLSIIPWLLGKDRARPPKASDNNES